METDFMYGVIQLPAAIVTVALYNVSIANAQANMEEVT
jgi:hypothetical protein